MTKPAKSQISLGIHPVWSVFAVGFMGSFIKDPKFLYVDSEDWSDWSNAQADLLACVSLLVLLYYSSFIILSLIWSSARILLFQYPEVQPNYSIVNIQLFSKVVIYFSSFSKEYIIFAVFWILYFYSLLELTLRKTMWKIPKDTGILRNER